MAGSRAYGHNGVPVFNIAAQRFNVSRITLAGTNRVKVAEYNPSRIRLNVMNIGFGAGTNILLAPSTSGAGYTLFGRPTSADPPQDVDLDVSCEVWASVIGGLTTDIVVTEYLMDIVND
jgi:hypothetical protein